METKKFDVTGMTCASCVAHVEKSVRKLDGIEAVNVQLMTNSMMVTYDDKRVDVKSIEDSVRKAGYEAHSSESEARKAESLDYVKAEQHELKNRFWVSLGFLIPLLYLSMGHMAGLPIPAFLSGYANLSAFALTQFCLTLPVVYLNRNFYSAGIQISFSGFANDGYIGCHWFFGCCVLWRFCHVQDWLRLWTWKSGNGGAICPRLVF